MEGKWEGVDPGNRDFLKIVYFTATDGSESVYLLREKEALCAHRSLNCLYMNLPPGPPEMESTNTT
jgi:hypothetical protein